MSRNKFFLKRKGDWIRMKKAIQIFWTAFFMSFVLLLLFMKAHYCNISHNQMQGIILNIVVGNGF